MANGKQEHQVIPQSADELLAQSGREFIMLAGKDSVGKSSALVSLLWYLAQTQPEVTGYVIDTENKFRTTVKGYGADAPKNFLYYKCENMNHVTASVEAVLAQAKPQDWILVESLSRVWEKAQDLGYEVTSGVSKVEYMERKRADRNIKSPIPGNPGDFWAIVKGAHDGAFFDLLTQLENINVICTTTLARVKEQRPGQKESADRKALRVELGIDANLEGAPRLPYYVETLCMLDLERGAVSCRVLRDNPSQLEDSRITFEVPTKRDWAMQFFAQCRG